MKQQDIVRELTRIAEPVVRSAGLAVWGIEVIAAGRMALRIYVDTPLGARNAPVEETDRNASLREAGGKGPDIDQCAKISRHIGLALEAEDILSHAYVLEVSSPGLERSFFTLEQLAPYVGNDLELKLFSPQAELPDRRRLRGRLLAVDQDGFSLLAYDAPEETSLSIRWNNVRKASLAPELPFSGVKKPGKIQSAPKTGALSK
jgi:ribosome maturation factor RimP